MNKGESDDVSCSASASAAPVAAPRSGGMSVRGTNPRETHHEVFGDGNLNTVMLVLILVHLMQYLMRPPCTC
ncbi:hypothetical protein H310_05167 [Aphanomyces invadans]|uniref:Uncharacterized protein n=1 Tax=Aphanomyces invadans TaxID=157072 RepID=A0A024UD44_9STRA|nr:hypothetical protein H310_05167 [Aphanomyces invadans]ETW03802.1 hypothetical protein H310_05167 [Aphanomyces invadans]|eukprot:XP_008868031.1 hypothetical protein H310_05167 [Aphanomyces invadans]